MNRQKHIQDELKSLQSTLPLINNPVFSVPEGYFEGLAVSVLAKVRSSELSAKAELGELSPLLAGIPKVTPYSVPSSYFDQTPYIPLTVGEGSSILAGIGKEVPYTVPQGYFEELPHQLLAKVATQKAKVIPLFARTWMRVASAAVIGGALFVAGYQFFDKKPVDNVAVQPPVEVQQNSVAKQTPVVQQDIKSISTQELEEFIETVKGGNEAIDKTTASKKNEVKELLKDVSDKDIESFLLDVASAEDELFVTD